MREIPLRTMNLQHFIALVALCLAAVALAVDPECDTTLSGASGSGTSSSSSSLSGSGGGDPHFVGFLGQKFDFDGVGFRVFNLITGPNFQLNSRFVPDAHFSGKTVMGEMGFKYGKSRVHAACSNSTMTVMIDGSSVSLGSEPVVLGDGIASFTDGKLYVKASNFEIEVSNHKTRNLQCFLDLETRTWYDGYTPDGILGRTVDSDKDIPSDANAAEFMLTSDNLFGNDFPVNLYQDDAELTQKIVGGRSVLSARSSRHLVQTVSCGCTEPASDNFDWYATHDDGSCVPYAPCDPNPCTFFGYGYNSCMKLNGAAGCYNPTLGVDYHCTLTGCAYPPNPCTVGNPCADHPNGNINCQATFADQVWSVECLHPHDAWVCPLEGCEYPPPDCSLGTPARDHFCKSGVNPDNYTNCQVNGGVAQCCGFNWATFSTVCCSAFGC